MKPCVFTPTVTILRDDDRIDIEKNLLVAEHLIDGGVDGILALGSTGEFTWLDQDDKKKYFTELSRAVSGRAELLLGVGGLYYRDTVDLAKFSQKLDAVRGVMVISEFYFNMSQDDFYSYYSYMAENIDGRVYVYNYPARTGSSISAETLARLAQKYPNIVGLKDSVGTFDHTQEVFDKVLSVRPDFEIFSGFDDQFAKNVSLGGAGGIGALSNIVPKLWSSWVEANREGDAERMAEGARRIDALMEIYRLESNPQKIIKEILKALGLPISTHCHFPYDTLKEGSLERALELVAQNDGAL